MPANLYPGFKSGKENSVSTPVSDGCSDYYLSNHRYLSNLPFLYLSFTVADCKYTTLQYIVPLYSTLVALEICNERNMNEMATKSYVQSDNTALFTCPECGFQKFIPTNNYHHKTNQIRVRCKCSNQFNLFLEFRNYFRADVNLDAECTITPGNGDSKKGIIVDPSMVGMCLQLDSAQMLTAEVQGVVEFTIDDRHKTETIKIFAVKSITGSQVHCEFLQDKEYQKELGFFLRK